MTGIKNPSLKQGNAKILDELVGTGGIGVRKDSYLSKPMGSHPANLNVKASIQSHTTT